MPNVAGAIETIESHLHPEPSFDVAKHPMPTGREEIWRFSPLKALRPLLAEGAPLGGLDWAGVSRVTILKIIDFPLHPIPSTTTP